MKITHKSTPVQKSGDDPLLITQGRHRVPAGGFPALDGQGKSGQEQGDEAGQHKDPPAQAGFINEAFKPLPHGQEGGDQSQQIGQYHPLKEIPVQQGHDLPALRPVHPADPDLLPPSPGGGDGPGARGGAARARRAPT